MKNLKIFAALVGFLAALALPARAAQYNFTPDAVTTKMNISPSGVAIGKGKTVATSTLDVVGSASISANLTVGGTLITGGTVTGTNPLVVSSATIGSGATISTFTATGDANIGGNITSAGSISATTSLAATTTIAATTGLSVSAGPIQPYKRTMTQLAAITPAVGDVYSCSNCTLTYDLVVGTGTTVNGFREVGTNHGAQ